MDASADSLTGSLMPQPAKRAMVWKQSHRAVGCNQCAWAYTPGAKDKKATSLQKAFDEHICEQFPTEQHFKAKC